MPGQGWGSLAGGSAVPIPDVPGRERLPLRPRSRWGEAIQVSPGMSCFRRNAEIPIFTCLRSRSPFPRHRSRGGDVPDELSPRGCRVPRAPVTGFQLCSVALPQLPSCLIFIELRQRQQPA